MALYDYHCHSRFSSDGRDGLPDLLEAAGRVGLAEIAVTDHCDMSGPFDNEAHRRDVWEARRRNRTGVGLLYAVELGEATHDLPRAERILAREPYDFVLGSYHALKSGEDFYLERYSSPGQCYLSLDAYMAELAELVAWGRFDVLGHLTYPLRYMCARDGVSLDFYGRYETALRRLFQQLVSRGLGIEVNLSGLYRTPPSPALPTADILVLYRACGGWIVTVGSDAHSAAYVGRGVAQGMDMLRAAGFSHITRYQERRPYFEKI